MKPQLQRCGDPYEVQTIAGGGFDSLNAKYAMAELIVAAGWPVEVLHVGDYDREGRDIFTALSEDVMAFVTAMGGEVTFTRLPEQMVALHLPPAPDTGSVQPRRSRYARAIVHAALRERLDLDQIAAVKRRSETFGRRSRPTCSRRSSTRRCASGSTWIGSRPSRGRARRFRALVMERLRGDGLRLGDLDLMEPESRHP